MANNKDPLNPCDLDRGEQFPAKLWELLRRNEKFQSDAAKVAHPKHRTSNKQPAQLTGSVPEYAKCAFRWMILKQDLAMTCEAHSRHSDPIEQRRVEEQIAQGAPLITCEQRWSELPLPFRDDFCSSVSNWFPIPDGETSDALSVRLRPLNSDLSRIAGRLESAIGQLNCPTKVEIDKVQNELLELSLIVSGIQRHHRCYGIPDKVIDEWTLDRFLAEIKSACPYFKRTNSDAIKNDSVLENKRQWEAFLQPKTEYVVFEGKTMNPGTAARGRQKVVQLIAQVYPRWCVAQLKVVAREP